MSDSLFLPENSSLAELVEWLKPMYSEVRVLEDETIVALSDLMFTRAIYIGMDRHGFEKRFCFQDPARAKEEYDKLVTGDDEPPEGSYVARR